MKQKQRKLIHPNLHSMKPDDINQAALNLLSELLERCTLSMVWQQTGITRTTLYRWCDESLPLEAMKTRDCAWFILVCETKPQLTMLLDHAPLSHPRLAGRVIKGEK